MDDLKPAQQRQYVGGQVCPSCDEIVGVADKYCRWCGTEL